jgi:hypothetical protein
MRHRGPTVCLRSERARPQQRGAERRTTPCRMRMKSTWPSLPHHRVVLANNALADPPCSAISVCVDTWLCGGGAATVSVYKMRCVDAGGVVRGPTILYFLAKQPGRPLASFTPSPAVRCGPRVHGALAVVPCGVVPFARFRTPSATATLADCRASAALPQECAARNDEQPAELLVQRGRPVARERWLGLRAGLGLWHPRHLHDRRRRHLRPLAVPARARRGEGRGRLGHLPLDLVRLRLGDRPGDAGRRALRPPTARAAARTSARLTAHRTFCSPQSLRTRCTYDAAPQHARRAQLPRAAAACTRTHAAAARHHTLTAACALSRRSLPLLRRPPSRCDAVGEPVQPRAHPRACPSASACGCVRWSQKLGHTRLARRGRATKSLLQEPLWLFGLLLMLSCEVGTPRLDSA